MHLAKKKLAVNSTAKAQKGRKRRFVLCEVKVQKGGHRLVAGRLREAETHFVTLGEN